MAIAQRLCTTAEDVESWQIGGVRDAVGSMFARRRPLLRPPRLHVDLRAALDGHAR